MTGITNAVDESSKRREITETNRRKWNLTAAVHEEAYVRHLRDEIASPDFTTFDDVERRIFDQIGLKGKSVIQLACNNGRELIAIKRAGAARCVGVDISEAFIAQAERLARAADVDVSFLRSDVYDLPNGLDGTFDLVYLTIGVLGWLPDLDGFFTVIERLLKPGGRLFVYEIHPILNLFEPETGTAMVASYFRTEPVVTESEPDYFNPAQTIDAPSYWFPHKLCDILGGCLRHDLRLTLFEEHPHDISNVFASFERQAHQLPLCFALVAQKERQRQEEQ